MGLDSLARAERLEPHDRLDAVHQHRLEFRRTRTRIGPRRIEEPGCAQGSRARAGGTGSMSVMTSQDTTTLAKRARSTPSPVPYAARARA